MIGKEAIGDWAGAISARKTVMLPTSLEDSEFRKRIVETLMSPPLAQLNDSLQRPNSLKEELLLIKKSMPKTGSVNQTVIYFVLMNYHNTSFNLARLDYSRQNYHSFAFWLDITCGMGYLNTISMGEDYLKGAADKILSDYIAEGSELLDIDISTGAESYLDLTQKSRNAALSLQKDPSGFLLIEEEIKKLKENPQEIAAKSQIPEFVIAGAEFAQKAYKQIYPIAKEI